MQQDPHKVLLMRCNICNASLSKPTYNEQLQGYEPCGTCLDVINDAVGTFYDKPYANEDELGYDDVRYELDALSISLDKYDET